MSSDHAVGVERVSPGTDDRWRRFVDDHPAATAFHAAAWTRAIRDSFGYDPHHRLLTVDDDVVGVVPGFLVSDATGQTATNPFCAYGFPLLRDGTEAADVLDVLASGVGSRAAVVLKDAPWSGVTGYARAGYGAVKMGRTWRLPVDGTYDDAWGSAFDTTLRTKLRTASRRVTVHEQTTTNALYRLYRETMRRKGSPQFSRAFVDRLVEACGDDATVLVGEVAGDPAAGVLALDAGRTRSLFVAGSDPAYWDDYPNDLLYAEQIRDAAQTPGVDVVDFGRTAPGSGVDEFKAQFGARSHPLYGFVTPPGRANRASVSSYRRLDALATRLSPLVTHPAVGPRLKEWIHE